MFGAGRGRGADRGARRRAAEAPAHEPDRPGRRRPRGSVRRREHLDHRVRAGLLTLVLLHGLGTGPSAWQPQLDALADRDVVAPDLVPTYRLGFQAAVDAVTGLLSAGDEVCGLSLGGLVALHVAARVDVRRIVVCAAFDRLPADLRRRTRALAVLARVMPRRLAHRQLAAELPEPYRERALEELASLTLGRALPPPVAGRGERRRREQRSACRGDRRLRGTRPAEPRARSRRSSCAASECSVRDRPEAQATWPTSTTRMRSRSCSASPAERSARSTCGGLGTGRSCPDPIRGLRTGSPGYRRRRR